MPQQHTGTVLYYAGDDPHEEYDTFSIGVTPDDPSLVLAGKKCLYISEKDTGERTYLRKLRKDDRVIFFEAGRGRNGPYYNLLQTNAQGGFHIEDPIVEDLLGPAQRKDYNQPPLKPVVQPGDYVIGPPVNQPAPPADEWEQFGAWADAESRKLATLYDRMADRLDSHEIEPRAIGAMADTLYIEWNKSGKRR